MYTVRCTGMRHHEGITVSYEVPVPGAAYVAYDA